MKKLIAGAAIVAAATTPFASSASAKPTCPGGLVSGVASAWPFAHGGEGAEEFAPPKGGFAKWVETFTPFDTPGEFIKFAASVGCVPPEG